MFLKYGADDMLWLTFSFAFTLMKVEEKLDSTLKCFSYAFIYAFVLPKASYTKTSNRRQQVELNYIVMLCEKERDTNTTTNNILAYK